VFSLDPSEDTHVVVAWQSTRDIAAENVYIACSGDPVSQVFELDCRVCHVLSQQGGGTFTTCCNPEVARLRCLNRHRNEIARSFRKSNRHS
jgi:hypothetical protein